MEGLRVCVGGGGGGVTESGAIGREKVWRRSGEDECRRGAQCACGVHMTEGVVLRIGGI